MTLRWGIVTAGKICHDFVNAFNSYPDKGNQIIFGIAARDKNKAEEFAAIHHIEKVFDSYEDMAKSKDIDVAYIGSLNIYHYDLAKLFLNNGKHVLCEKPLCFNSDEVESLTELARTKNLFLMEGIWSRFSPAYYDLEQIIASGVIGDVRFLEANFGIFTEDKRITTRNYGGSAVLDIGVYVLQLAQFVFKDSPKRVIAVGKRNHDEVDVSETIVLEYDDDRRAVLNTNTQLELVNQAVVYGTKGHITLQPPFHFPNKMILQDGKVKEYTLHTSALPYHYENSAGLVYEAIEVEKCIRQGLTESPRMSHSESRLLALLEDCVRRDLNVSINSKNRHYKKILIL
ncbi:trans-1,2-dihydrobenzene-1,2-diol dehydrogenase-like [Trichoplusia ni]|uniref:Trans-1,2-dihydrobenzene-1,2-diol dehydrogenase n=1 Tax=Trichoplusia ni TaxID=7111 RepID=A0A7E5VRW4_TRINI|nr:trans-1,2-dihydrobenzene-1,2-diol dehydrogenase-like [Trichoplusia ni]